MTMYEKNLKVLAKYYPQMDELIENAKKDINNEIEVLEEESYNGEPVLKIKKEDRCFYLNGKRETREPAKMWVESLGKLETNAPIFMMGVGNWNYLQQLTEQTKEQITIVVYEPSIAIFLKFLNYANLESIMKRHVVAFWVEGLKGMELKEMPSVLKPILKYEMLPYARTLILPNYDIIFSDKAIEFMKILRDTAYEDRVQYNTKRSFSNVVGKNILGNLPYLCKGYKSTQLVDIIPRDIPGIVVAAGPSLNKNIQDLKQAKGKAFIVAVDTAIKPLLNAGIVPDMFAVVDGVKPLALIEKEEVKEIPLLCTLTAANEILRYHTGKKIFFNEGFQYAERIFLKTGMRVGDVSSGGSVATHLFSLLYKIGIERIILVGQDLALTGNKSHADGTFHEKMEELDTSNALMVEGNCEKEVPTRSDFKIYIDWYNMYIKGCKEYRKDLRVINATEGGAKLKNTEIMTLKEAIERECTKEVNIQECFKQLQPMLSAENQRWAANYVRHIPEDFKEISEEAQAIRKMYTKLANTCKKRNIDTKEYLSILKKIGKAIEKMDAKSAYQLVSITLADAQFILKNEQFLHEDSVQKEGTEIARKGIIYMENVEKCAKLFEQVAKEVLEETEALEGL